ncbi:MAG: prephenate dehydrogenase, partial [Rhodoluna sp.]
MTNQHSARSRGPVRIVGAGLLGTSIGLALTKLGVSVSLEDSSPANLKLAIDYGAGTMSSAAEAPRIIVVCVPPDVTASVVARELESFPGAVVTDVASVKAQVLAELKLTGADLTRYVGSHPMAGRERGGAMSGRADLFVSRPWVISANETSSAIAIAAIEDLAIDLGAAPIKVSASDHDRAVALVSHVPQVVSSLLAARLVSAEGSDVSLAGQGLRDTTRIAASDPKLWIQILASNASEITPVLKAFEADVHGLVEALEHIDQAGSLAKVSRALEAGNQGVERIPGKHGTKQTAYAQVVVMIADKPGELGRLFNEVGEIGVNIEELKLEHSPSAEIGLVELYVMPPVEQKLITDLE